MRLRPIATAAFIAAAMSAGGASPPEGFSITHLGNFDSEADATTYTITAAALGEPHANRKVQVNINLGGVSNTQITSVTIGGVAAVKAIGEAGASGRICEAWYAAVPTGTTGDIVITHSVGSNTRIGVDWWRVISSASAPSAISGANPDIGTSNTSLAAGSVTVPAGGGAIAYVRIGLTGPISTTWEQTSGTGVEGPDRGSGDIGLWTSSWWTLAAGPQIITATQSGAAAQMRILSVAWPA